jgi:uncharacterized protein YjcR
MTAKGTPEDHQAAAQLYRDGMPIRQIAQKYKVTSETIRNWLRKVSS